MDQSQQPSHSDQSTFIKFYNNENGQKIRNMNQNNDESCWTDSQKQDISFSDQQFYSPSQKKLDAFNTQIQSVILSSNRDVLKNTNDVESESVQKKLLQCQTLLKKDQTSFIDKMYSSENNQISPLIQTQRSKFDVDNQTINKSQSNYQTRKMLTLFTTNFEMTEFKNKLRLLTRIKINMKYFMKSFTNISRTKLLNNKIRKIINDLSDYKQKKQDDNIISILPSFLKKCNLLVKLDFRLLDPQSQLGFIIKLILTFVNSIYLFLFSLFIVFQVNSSLENVLRISMTFFWIFELIINLNTKVYIAPIVIDKRKLIFQYFLKNQAFFDVFPLIIMQIPINEQSKMIKIIVDILVFFKLPNVILYHREIQLQLCMRIRKYYFVQLFNLVSMLFLIAHVIALIWYIIAIFEQRYLDEIPTWLDDILTHDRVWWKVYIQSLYWSLSLMAMGSNTSITILQTFFTTFVLLFTSIAFGYIQNVIGIILSEMDQRNDNKRKDINIINEYMRKKNISEGLQARVNLNLEYFYTNVFKKEEIEDLQVLDKISTELKDSMLLEYNKQILNKIEFLSKFSPETQDCILLHLKEEYYFPNQIIYVQNDAKDQSLMYVIQGQVELFHEINKDLKQQVKLQKINSGQIFGQLSFFTGMARDLCAKTTQFTQIIKIDRNVFLEAIKNNEKEFQEFCQIKDKILMYKQYNYANLLCATCKESTHIVQDCSLICFNKEAKYKFMGIEEKQIQNRKYVKRKFRLRVKTIKLIRQVSSTANQYITKLRLENSSHLRRYDITPFDSQYSNLEYDDYNSEEYYEEEIEEEEEMDEMEDEVNSEDDEDQRNLIRLTQSDNTKTDSEMKIKGQGNSSKLSQEKIQISSQSNQRINLFTGKKSVSFNDQEDILQVYENLKQIKKNLSEQEIRQPQLSQETIRLANQRKSTKEFSESSIRNYFASENTNLDERLEPGQIANTKKLGFKRPSIKKIHNKNQSRQSLIDNIPAGDSLKQITYEKKMNLLIEKLITHFDKEKQLSRQNTNMSIKPFHASSPKENYNNQSLLEFNPWEFDSLKDFKYYFPHGNSKVFLQKYSRQVKKKQRFARKTTSRK